jgi:adenylosuccinate synthase
VLTKVYNRRTIDADAVAAEYLRYGQRLGRYVADTGLILNQALNQDKVVLLEGAQATLLDVDHGTYPFVTSSSPTAGGACAGSGLGPTRITRVIGILKAYTTRVGAGPFPTELTDAQGEWLRKTGSEYGVTTGRPRRTGWFDAVIARYATRVNGITDYFITKLDVLSGLEKVPVCVGYDVDGRRQDEMPMTQTEFHHAVPVYEYLDGWWEDISQVKDPVDLPPNARAYLAALEDLIGAPISAVGVGPRRDQTLQLRPAG